MLNRQHPPSTPPLPNLRLPHIERKLIATDVPLCIIPTQESPLVFLSILFPAGSWYASRGGIAGVTAEMLIRGTEHKDSFTIASEIEYCGAQLSCTASQDNLYLQLTSPAAHMDKLLALLKEIIRTPSFPDPALKALKPILYQSIQQTKADPPKLGYKILQQRVFGETHPYGSTLEEKTLSTLTTQQLRRHYQQCGNRPTQLCISGPVTAKMVTALANIFDGTATRPIVQPIHQIHPMEGNLKIPKANSTQASIHMGHRTITRSHPDYPALYITNKLLGGFFGSRLMQNIREDKGYTYGISTIIRPRLQHGFWYLGTSVKKEYAVVTCKEIAKEIKILKTTPIQLKELNTLKKYLLGELLETFDSPFAANDQWQAVSLHGLDFSYFLALEHTIRHIDAQKIQEMACRYLAPPDLCKVIIGG